jgi:membrane-bound lytic murein transglycosylase D
LIKSFYKKVSSLLALCITLVILLTPLQSFALYRVEGAGAQVPVQKTQWPGATSLWQVLQKKFAIDNQVKRPEVQAQIKWYMAHPKYIYELANNAKPYLYYIMQQVDDRGLPAELVLLPMIESAYDPFAYSPAGAAGLWQMMPGTASGFGLEQNWWYDGRRDIVASTSAALDYLAYLQKFFNGNWMLATAAYDSGEGTVLSAIRKNVAKGESTDFWSLSLPRETKAYIPKLLALAEIISNPKKYSIALPEVENKPYLMQVNVGSQIDLKTAAKLSGLSLENLLMLNAGFNRWATAPDGPDYMLLPIENVAIFQQNLAKLPESERVTWKRYTVVSGDSLGSIAHKNHTTVALLKQVNKQDTDLININDVLFIPMSTTRLPSEVISSAQKYVDAKEEHLPGPRRVVHTVQKGDSVWSVANKYNVSTAAVRFWNNLKTGAMLSPGQPVLLWLKAKPHKTPDGTNIHSLNYKVKMGDSLGAIARKYHTNVPTIRFVNNLDSDVIHQGQELIVYENLKNNYYADPLQISYTVQAGDSLDKIAYKFDTNPTLIKQLNILSSNLLKINQEIVVIPHALPTIKKNKSGEKTQMVYIVKANDNLVNIANKYKVTVAKIQNWNPRLKDSVLLSPGEIVFLNL